MHSFLKQYPYKMGEHTLTCTLSPRGGCPEVRLLLSYKKKEDVQRGVGASDLKKYPEGSGVVQTAAANPPVEPSVAKKGPISIPHVKEEMSAGWTEPSEPHPEWAVRDPAPRLVETSEKAGAGGEGTAASLTAPGTETPAVKSEEMLLPPPSCVLKEEVVKVKTEPEWFEPALVPVLEKKIKEEEEELSISAFEPLEEFSHVCKAEEVPSDCDVKPGDVAGAVPEALSPHSGAAAMEMVSPAVTQPNSKLDAPEKNPLSDAVKTEHEMPVTQITEKKPVLKTELTTEKKLEVAGVDREVNPEESVLQAGRAAEENPEKLLLKTGAETEKKLEKFAAKVGTAVETTANAVGENKEGGVPKAPQNKGTGPAKTDETRKAVPLNSSLSVKESSSVSKMILKAVVSLPDISKSRFAGRRNELSLCKAGEQKALSKPETRARAALEKKIASKEVDHLRPGRSSLGDGGGECKARGSAADGKGENGRNPSQQEKDSRADSRASSKQSQEGESRSSGTKKDGGSNKVSGGGNAKASKGGTNSSAKHKEEEELFPFNLDEFVTVDEVVEEIESPVKIRRNPPRGKRKDGAKTNSAAEPSSKRRKGKSSVARAAESELSFVTLDEIGEEEDAQLGGAANLEALSDPQNLVVVDEVMEEEELMSEAVKNPQALVTLDEISEQEELRAQKDVPRPAFEEQDLKAEPLVTVDEIGEVEELPLNEPTDLSVEDALKQKEEDKGTGEDPGDGASSQVPDDPSALVTVDEIPEDNEDNPLVTLDEVNEDEDDFLADFNRLKEGLNFVTVDEVGEEDEEEENTSPGKNPKKGEDEEDIVAVAGPEEKEVGAVAGPEEEDIVAVAGPEEMEVLGHTGPEEETPAACESKGKELLVVSRGEIAHGRLVPGTQEMHRDPCSSKPLFNAHWWPPVDPPASGDEEPQAKGKKTASLDVSKAESTPKDLDYLVPKAGFFCQICSLFYADETSVKNHCKTLLHQQNMEKFMAKQKEEENNGEEPSSR
ncbi:ZN638 protein, partial [Pterocles burchelli]|nr:ZN638 protein [Pterocles burchelli]